jgi:WD40 repeat protein
MEWTIELEDYISGVQWSPDGSRLAASTVTGLMAVFDATTGSEHQYLRAHVQPITRLKWSPRLRNSTSDDSTRLATASHDGTAILWNPESPRSEGEIVAILDCGKKHLWVEQCAWSFDGNFLATAAGKIVRVWTRDGTLVRHYEHAKRTVTDLAWHPTLHELAVASYGGVSLYRIDEETLYCLLPIQASILALAWSPDGSVIAAGLQENAVQFWRLPFHDGDDAPSAMRGYPEKVRTLAFDRTGAYLATPSSRGVAVWEFLRGGPEGTTPVIIEGHLARVTQAAFQHKGHLLASADESGLVLISQPSINNQTLKAEAYQHEVSQLAWSPDDQRIAIGTERGIVDVWKV